MVRLLKLSVNGDSELSSEDVLSIHLGYFITYGKVVYSTNVKVAEQPQYVLLTLGNVEDVCYLCHVLDYSYNTESIEEDFIEYSPDRYKNDKKSTWLMFDTMQRIPVDFLDEILSEKTVQNFIKERAVNKTLWIEIEQNVSCSLL